MTTKRYFALIGEDGYVYPVFFDSENEDKEIDVDTVVDLLNENEQLRHDATILIQSNQDYRKKNEQLKQDNNALIHLLENQSMIIEELHFKLLEYQVKEPIALTKKDLELMDKAISYYTHGRCGE